MAKQTKKQSKELKNLIHKITEQSYLVKDIAQTLDYGLAEDIVRTVLPDFPHSYRTYLDLRYKETHKDFLPIIRCEHIHPYGLNSDEDTFAQLVALDKQYVSKQQVNKLVFPVNSYRIEAAYDSYKKIVFEDSIYLQLKPEVAFDYFFAMYWFNSPFAHFLFYAQRKNNKQITVEDLRNLPFPKLNATQYKELAPQLAELLNYYSYFYEQMGCFWGEFTEHFYRTKYIGTHIEYTFFQYTWDEFMQKILAIRRKMKLSLGVSRKVVKELLYEHFQAQKYIASALAYKINALEKEVARYLFQLYNLTAEEIALIENEN